MRTFLGQILAGIVFLSGTAFAQLQDVQITATRQKLDEQKKREGGPVTITTKDIAYEITVQNKTFKPLTELQVKYMVFYLDPKPGSADKPVELSLKGAETLTNLEGNRSVSFTTKPVKLTTEELDGGWYWTGGGSSRTKDKVSGVWIRAFANGKIVGEYANPSTVSRKNEWKEQ